MSKHERKRRTTCLVLQGRLSSLHCRLLSDRKKVSRREKGQMMCSSVILEVLFNKRYEEDLYVNYFVSVILN